VAKSQTRRDKHAALAKQYKATDCEHPPLAALGLTPHFHEAAGSEDRGNSSQVIVTAREYNNCKAAVTIKRV
jgi:hypothetical protein